MSDTSDMPGARRALAVAAGAACVVHDLGAVPSAGATIALTFDDGPSPTTTGLVDALGGAPATFFLVGDHLDRRPEVVADLGARGHAVGIHGWSHTSFPDLGDDELRDELTTTADAVERLGGTRPRLVRPPYGHLDERTAAVVRALGLTPVLWSVDPRDWDTPGVEQIVEHTVEAAFDGAIVLFHDRSDRPGTEAAVARLVTALPAAGYELVAL